MAMTEMNTWAELADDTALLADPDALREKAERDGVLFFRGLVDRQTALELREQVLTVAQRFGWIDPDAPADAGVVDAAKACEGGVGPDYHRFYTELQTLRAMHALALHDDLIKAFEKLFDGPVLAHPRNIIRTIYPRSDRWTTPAHQDFVQIAGTVNTWTAWVPLSDCARDGLGGLAVLPGSHKQGVLKMHAAEGAGGVGVAVPDHAVWHGTDFQAGDAILFHSLLVHQGLNNQTADRLRVSADMRYQPANEPVHASSLRPHHGHETWESIYDRWPDDDDPLKYYWRAFDLRMADNMPEKPTP